MGTTAVLGAVRASKREPGGPPSTMMTKKPWGGSGAVAVSTLNPIAARLPVTARQVTVPAKRLMVNSPAKMRSTLPLAPPPSGSLVAVKSNRVPPRMKWPGWTKLEPYLESEGPRSRRSSKLPGADPHAAPRGGTASVPPSLLATRGADAKTPNQGVPPPVGVGSHATREAIPG